MLNYSLFQSLKNLKNYYTKNQVFFGVLKVLGVALGGFLAIFLLGLVFGHPVYFRVALLGILALALSVSFSFWVLRPVFYKPSLESIALKLEEEYPQLQDRLIATLQLQKDYESNPFGYSKAMMEQVFSQAEKMLSEIDTKAIVDKTPLKKFAKVTSALAMACLLFGFGLQSSFEKSFFAFSHPLTEIKSPPKFAFSVTPGNATVLKYSDVKIGIKLEPFSPTKSDPPSAEKQNKALPKKVRLYYKTDPDISGSDWDYQDLIRQNDWRTIQRDSKTDFDYIFPDVKADFEYYVEALDEESQKFSIKVVDKPRVIDVKLTYKYPGYTKLKTQFIDENNGNISALVGTKIQIQALSNRELKEAYLVFSDTISSRDSLLTKMNVRGKKANSEIVVRKNSSYHILLKDIDGNTNPDPIEYEIKATPDEYPELLVEKPGKDVDLDESMLVNLVILGRDDFGFSDLSLEYSIVSGNNVSDPVKIQLPVDKDATEFITEYRWSLAKVGLVPGDVLSYKIILADNDTFSGPKKTESKIYSIRVPTSEEIIAEVQKGESEQISGLEEVLKSQKELEKKVEKLAREMLSQKEINWERKKELESFLEKQKSINEELEKLAEKFSENLEKMEKNKLTAQEMIQKMQEINRLMEEISTPELKELMKKLQEAMQQLDPNKIRQMMKDMQLTQEQMIERLDRTISLLKQIQAENKMETLVQMAEKMLASQKEINEKIPMCNSQSLSELSKEEEKIGQQAENVEQNLEELQKMMEEMPLLSPQEIQEMKEGFKQAQVQEEVAGMVGQMCQNKGTEALRIGKKIQNSLQQLSEQLSKARAQMQAGQKQEILAAFKKIIYNMFYLSDTQEELYNKTDFAANRNVGLKELAKEQKELETGTLKVASDLQQLSQKTVFVTPDILKGLTIGASNMQEAGKRLFSREGRSSLQYQIEALAILNLTAKQLLESMNQASSSSSGSGADAMFSRLQSLAQKQKSLNQQSMEFSLGQQGQSMEMQGEMERLAAEQEAIRKSLEQMQKEFGKRSEILGRADELGKEMQEVVQDLENQKLGEQTLKKQEKILSRLLDYQKSLEERDFSKQRKAERGEELVRKSPAQLKEEMLKKENQKSFWEKMQEDEYPPEYEELIKAYFKALSGENK